ncbi:MAG: IS66 family insertion sequence element accessory protein TnpB [Chloroflexales bacterium]
MLSLPPSVRIFLCLSHADMRRGFDALARMAQEVFEQDPLSGHLFVFRSRRGDRLKILYWDRDGFALWYKRLEEGTFAFPEAAGPGACISASDLAMILGGIEAGAARRRKRYQKGEDCSFSP